MPPHSESPQDRLWHVLRRWQQYEAESLVNLLRVLAVGVFYLAELATVHWGRAPDEQQFVFHRVATAVAGTWLLVALAVVLCLRNRFFPSALMFFSTAADIVLLSALAARGSGPASPLVFAYFFVLALVALRFSLPLLWFATAGCAGGYVVLLALGHPDWLGDPGAPKVVPRLEELLVLLSLIFTALALGQTVRRAHTLALALARRLQAAEPRS